MIFQVRAMVCSIWALHPIYVTWFLVDFSKRKLPKYYIIVYLLFLLSKARQAKRKRKSRNQNDKKLKTKLPKFVKSQAIVAHYYFLHFIFQEKEEKAWVSKNKSHFNDIDDFDLSFDWVTYLLKYFSIYPYAYLQMIKSYSLSVLFVMAIRVVEFLNRGYKIRKVFA